MSVDRTAIIARGFLVDEDPRDIVSDDFYDEYVINFDAWDDCGPFLIGYYVQTCSEGLCYELSEMATPTVTTEAKDKELIAAASATGLIVPDIKTYFGVRVS